MDLAGRIASSWRDAREVLAELRIDIRRLKFMLASRNRRACKHYRRVRTAQYTARQSRLGLAKPSGNVITITYVGNVQFRVHEV